MAKLLATNYLELEHLHTSKDREEIKIGHNTKSVSYLPEFPLHAIHLHGHKILEVAEDKIWFSLAGWNTVTTRERINQFLREYDHNIYVRKFIPYLSRYGELDKYYHVELDSDAWYSINNQFEIEKL